MASGANHLIDRLQEQGIPVIVITGYTAVSLPPGKVEAILQKPVSEEQFLAVLRPIVARQTEPMRRFSHASRRIALEGYLDCAGHAFG